MDDSVLPRLERAELAAREVELAATAEASRILEVARQEARRLSDEVPARIEAAIADRRSTLLAGAEGEVAAIESAPARPAAEAPEARRRADATVERIVAAVLGEAT
jgi:hypothetical protein